MSHSEGFDPRRLTLARWSKELSKKELAQRADVSAASVTQYEAGRTVPSPAIQARMALACGVSTAYLHRSGDRRRPEFSGRSFFRSLRSTSQRERDRADALAEHVLDVVEVLERKVNLPVVEIPQIQPIESSRGEIEEIAAAVRKAWAVPTGPVANVVRLLEAHGIVLARLLSNGRRLDAFSRWFEGRPLVVLWADKSDKARSRFDAAHELGHLVMHDDAEPASPHQEREANMFSSAFHMPAREIADDLIRKPPTLEDWPEVLRRRAHWGVSAKALLYRSREMGTLSEAAFRRSMQNYNRHHIGTRDGSELGDPEIPVLLSRAANALGMGADELANESSLSASFVAELISPGDAPKARLVAVP